MGGTRPAPTRGETGGPVAVPAPGERASHHLHREPVAEQDRELGARLGPE